MKLLLKNDDNSIIEIRKIETLDKNAETLFFFLKYKLSEEDIKTIEDKLKVKTGKNVVILNNDFTNKILGI